LLSGGEGDRAAVRSAARAGLGRGGGGRGSRWAPRRLAPRVPRPAGPFGSLGPDAIRVARPAYDAHAGDPRRRRSDAVLAGAAAAGGWKCAAGTDGQAPDRGPACAVRCRNPGCSAATAALAAARD